MGEWTITVSDTEYDVLAKVENDENILALGRPKDGGDDVLISDHELPSPEPFHSLETPVENYSEAVQEVRQHNHGSFHVEGKVRPNREYFKD